MRIASAYRQELLIIALAKDTRLVRQLSLIWGVRAFHSTATSATAARALLIKNEIISRKDRIVFLASDINNFETEPECL